MFSASKTGAGASGYLISNSLRFQSASSTYLARTPASNGNRQVFTFSYWAKRGTLSVAQEMYFVNSGSGNFAQISWNSSNQIDITSADSSVAICQLITTPVYRDPSAWYHIVFSIDTTQATASNRVKIYVNGSQVTALSTATYPSLNYNFQLNNTTAQNIGRPTTGTFDGYLAEVNFIDGQALTPSSFGETDTTTGQWVAKKYTGTYGTNGFYLPFSNGTSTTTLGADSSGNGNNWTLNNFTRSAGVSDCWMTDVPSGNGGVSGTQPSSNYAVLNPLVFNTGLTTISNANLNAALGNASNWRSALSTISVRSGLWYAEMVVSSNANNFFGVALSSSTFWNAGAVSIVGWTTDSWSYSSTGSKYTNATAVALGSAMSAGDIIGIALDLDNGAIYFSANGVFLGGAVPTSGPAKTGAAYSLTTGLEYIFAISGVGGTTASINFGQRSFAYTPPTGFKALCTANLPAATIVKGNQYMDATLYTGTGAAQNIVNAGSFQPDFVWIKDRSAGQSNRLFDAVRGATKFLSSNATDAEVTNSVSLTSFNSNGFSLGSGAVQNQLNNSFVAWQWNAGSDGSTIIVSNTTGSITSQVLANPTAGVSIVTFTSTGAAATVGHGLGVAPSMIIVKARNNVSGWPVYHASIGNTGALRLDTTSATSTSIDWWRNTSPTSSVFSIGANFPNTFTEVAYCFSEISGFSKAFSYTGNGSADGSFVYCGFRPKFVMYKRTDTSGLNWVIWDTSRDPYNVVGQYLLPNTSGAEGTSAALDILSNGFKLRTSGANDNASGGTYVGIAFAESPFASSNAR